MLTSVVSQERDEAAALKFVEKALERHGLPKAVATDGLDFYKDTFRTLSIKDRQEVALA